MTKPIRRRVVTQRRRRPFIAGIWLAVAGVALTIVGSLLLFGNQAVQVLAAEDRASVSTPLRFEAEEGSYVVLLLPTTVSGGLIGNPVAQLTCDVALADGTTALLRGSRQSSSIETSAGETVGSFDAVAGSTTVTCDFTDRRTPLAISWPSHPSATHSTWSALWRWWAASRPCSPVWF